MTQTLQVGSQASRRSQREMSTTMPKAFIMSQRISASCQWPPDFMCEWKISHTSSTVWHLQFTLIIYLGFSGLPWLATGLWKAHGSGQSFFFQLHPWVNIYDLTIEFKKWSHWHKAGMRKLFNSVALEHRVQYRNTMSSKETRTKKLLWFRFLMVPELCGQQ